MIHMKVRVFTWNLRNIKEATLPAPLLDLKAAPHTSKTCFLPGGKSLRQRIKRQFCHLPATWPWTRKPLNLSLLLPFHWGNREINTRCKLAWMLPNEQALPDLGLRNQGCRDDRQFQPWQPLSWTLDEKNTQNGRQFQGNGKRWQVTNDLQNPHCPRDFQAHALQLDSGHEPRAPGARILPKPRFCYGGPTSARLAIGGPGTLPLRAAPALTKFSF